MYPRFIDHRAREALTDTRVVMIVGPRQSGKTTLAEGLAGGGMEFLTLDDATTLAAAWTAPSSTRYSGPPSCCWPSSGASMPTGAPAASS
jgi:hypothetical protein